MEYNANQNAITPMKMLEILKFKIREKKVKKKLYRKTALEEVVTMLNYKEETH